jgi:hypothetical protein
MNNTFYIFIVFAILGGILGNLNQFFYKEWTREKIKFLFEKNGMDFKDCDNAITYEITYCIKQALKSGISTHEFRKTLRIGILHLILYFLSIFIWIGIVIWWIYSLI